MSSILNAENWIDGLPDTVRDEVRSRLQPVILKAGQHLYDAGDTSGGIFRVATGYLRLTGLQEDGRLVLITIYAPGACFAETAVVARRRLNHCVTAMTSAAVDFLPTSDFWELYTRLTAIPDALCRKFAENIGRQLEARESRATQRLGRRIAALFADLVDRCGEPTNEGGAIVNLPLTHTDLAEFFDVTRQSIQREMTLLKRVSGLSKVGGKWCIADVRVLRNI